MSPRHGRRRSVPLRELALAAGALTVVAGVGAGFALDDTGTSPADPDHRTAAEGAVSSASPMAEETAPTPSPSRTSASPSATPREKKSRTPETKAAPTKAPATAEREAPVRPSPRRTAERSGPTGTTAETTTAGQILRLVNEERSRAGCPALKASAALNRAAQKYSETMAADGELSHTGPDGSTVADRVGREGYAWSAVGENIAVGQQDAESVMDSWMNSEGHRANILNCSFEELGVGVQDSGGPWWTQVFGSGR